MSMKYKIFVLKRNSVSVSGGTVERALGSFANPEQLAFGGKSWAKSPCLGAIGFVGKQQTTKNININIYIYKHIIKTDQNQNQDTPINIANLIISNVPEGKQTLVKLAKFEAKSSPLLRMRGCIWWDLMHRASKTSTQERTAMTRWVA